MDLFTFSLAINPDHVNLFVYWVEEIISQITIWYMSRLELYDFRLLNDYRRLYYDIDNILD